MSLDDAIPTDELSIGYYYKIRNINRKAPPHIGMLFYTFRVDGKYYARFMDMKDMSKMKRFHPLEEVVYAAEEWTFHAAPRHNEKKLK